MAEKVLIIDDDSDTLRLVGLMLQHQGYEISTADGGEVGLLKATREGPDVILLDVMMPEMDGYEVARRLRADAATRTTPILMFTARSQLEDRVAAFEAGADDYLTKPTNPTDLQAHVRHLLEHGGEQRRAPAASKQDAKRTRRIAVLSARAGMGASTVAVNVAAALQMRGQAEVILAEFTPGQGTQGMELGVEARGLPELLKAEPEAINPQQVEAALARHTCGLRLLLSSDNPRNAALSGRSAQFEAVFNALGGLAPYAVLDLGAGLPPWASTMLSACEDRIVVTDALPNTLQHTRILLDEIKALGIPEGSIQVVLNHRVRFDTQFPASEAEQTLGHPIALTLRPAPEMIMAASRRHMPGVIAMPEDFTAQQLIKLADGILATAEAA